MDAPTLELLAWIAEQPRSYRDTMDAWSSHCPRLTIWEDALAGGLVVVGGGAVRLSDSGRAALSPAS